ncbi:MULTISPECIES: hypothetical protein [Kocuria]|uniref:Uncharacterized protein n=1 Tax=Kocuria subflava TaxID=1736139 RepID=A0A846TTW7_9MICC|nr:MULTISPECIES: hypothetical protein [Kocuria]NKE10450.1 hypothetical protein [Kocuria subflava]
MDQPDRDLPVHRWAFPVSGSLLVDSRTDNPLPKREFSPGTGKLIGLMTARSNMLTIACISMYQAGLQGSTTTTTNGTRGGHLGTDAALQAAIAWSAKSTLRMP